MTVYVVDSWQWRDGVSPYDGVNRVRTLVAAGAVNVDVEVAERDRPFRAGDVVLTFVNPPGYRFLDDVSPWDRWLVTVDESSLTTAPYQRQLKRCWAFGMHGVVTTYASPEHLRVLLEAGLKVSVLPFTMEPLRPRIEKTEGILVSGNLDPVTYPERARVARIVAEAGLPHRVLPHPGYELRDARHEHVREGYQRLLDGFELAVVCRAGHRDRLVGKYYEFARSHVLPVGDCPTYMPQECRQAMVDTMLRPADDVVAELRRLSDSPDELRQRQEAYAAAMLRHYDPADHGRRVLEEVRR